MTPDRSLARVHKHRVEALNDGIYAVAMTLLVLELKLPEEALHASDAEFVQALANLAPKFIAWLLSFFILALFWIGHQRAFHFVRHVDTKLTWINVLGLLFASLMPFSSALIGEHAGRFASQVFYDANMAALALVTLLQLSHIRAHPELCDPPMPAALAAGARFRCWSLVVLALVGVAIAWRYPRFGTMSFVLMFLLARLGRRAEARAAAKDALLNDRPFP
jgi:uncharacterized membrane protein